MEPLRIGLLGAARISDVAVIQPADEIGARLVAVAARDPGRAVVFAARHGIERVLNGYQDVIDDPEVEVVYNPLANALHAPWNLRAIAAGKHVLSEKPYASNAHEARTVRDAAKAAGVHCVEAFHYRYHPLMRRMLELAVDGEIGDLVRVEARMLMPPPAAGDLRWDASVAGGGLMDVGCYAVHAIRDLAGSGRRRAVGRGGAGRRDPVAPGSGRLARGRPGASRWAARAAGVRHDPWRAGLLAADRRARRERRTHRPSSCRTPTIASSSPWEPSSGSRRRGRD